MEKIIYAVLIVILLLMAVLLLFPGVRRFIRSLKNDKAPVLTECSHLKKKVKKTKVASKNGIIETFWLEFEIDGRKIKCFVPSAVFYEIPENVSGQLTYQGEYFESFLYNGIKIEK